jgi:nucleotide-binding universal stress UspA family protein
MSYATLMVQLELGRSNAAPLGVTRDLAKRWPLAVTGVAGAQPMQTALAADGFYAGDFVREDKAWIDQEAKAAEDEFRAEMQGHIDGIEWNMAATRYPLSSHIARQASDADILVVGLDHQADFANSARRVDVNDLIMQAGHPVMVVPLTVRHFNFHCALVAWKDSREARHSLTCALPLLRQMDRVVIAQAAEPSRRDAAQAELGRMEAWLRRHGIQAEARLALSGGSDGERLLDLADEVGAEVIVAGAYGHSRLREWVLGGVTRDLLLQGRRCLFLSH